MWGTKEIVDQIGQFEKKIRRSEIIGNYINGVAVKCV